MVPLQLVAIVFTGLSALCVVLARDTTRQAMLFSVYGFGLVVLFFVYQAPDVALSALVVSSIAYPLVLVGAIARVAAKRKRRAE
jgi:energy-converting hydrogenase B subunit D